ncbi:hypothetical protein Slala03_54230 [Streptomyces lavendulae subsp. lavendulae]|nr:hypothetical protein Slala03_54230 [Streptomyces lavendulae subsp. lavendulae]
MVEPALTRLARFTANETHRLDRAIVAISVNPELGAEVPGIRPGVTRRPGSGQPREVSSPPEASPEDRSLSPEEVMPHPTRTGNDFQVEPVQQLIGGLPESYS